MTFPPLSYTTIIESQINSDHRYYMTLIYVDVVENRSRPILKICVSFTQKEEANDDMITPSQSSWWH